MDMDMNQKELDTFVKAAAAPSTAHHCHQDVKRTKKQSQPPAKLLNLSLVKQNKKKSAKEGILPDFKCLLFV